jgi:hypothetical protein
VYYHEVCFCCKIGVFCEVDASEVWGVLSPTPPVSIPDYLKRGLSLSLSPSTSKAVKSPPP